jgi:hypothetical protein
VPGAERVEDQRAEPGARGPERVALAVREPRQPDRLRGLDDRDAVREGKPPRLDGPSERIGHRRVPPFPAEGAVQGVGGALAAVGDR